MLVVLLAVAGGMGASVNAASGRAVMHWFPAGERGFALGVRQTAIPIGGALAALALAGRERRGRAEGVVHLPGRGLPRAARLSPRWPFGRRRGPAPELEAEDVEWTLRDSRLWVLSTGSGLYLFAQIALTAFLVLFLHDVHGLSPGAAAAVLAVIQVGAVVTRISAGPDLGRDAGAHPAVALDRPGERRRRAAHGGRDACAGGRRPAGDGRRGCDLDGLERPLGDRRRRARRASRGAAPRSASSRRRWR